jgi:hypothetical protein
MTQLVMHARDEESGSFGPVYTVCVLEGRILVRALRRAWTNTASSVEKALNRSRATVLEDAPNLIASKADLAPTETR